MKFFTFSIVLFGFGAANISRTCKDLTNAATCEATCQSTATECFATCGSECELDHSPESNHTEAEDETPSQCYLRCSTKLTECENDCPCHCNCPHGCPCQNSPDWVCPTPVSCEESSEEQARDCIDKCIDNQKDCQTDCSPFDLVCLGSCSSKGKACFTKCPCNDSIGQGDIMFPFTKNSLRWSHNATDTMIYSTSKLDMDNYNDYMGCHVYYDNKHWFIGGHNNLNDIYILDQEDDDNSCTFTKYGYTPSISYHSCAVFDDAIYACGNANDGGKTCLAFSNRFFSGFQKMGTLATDHRYGFTFSTRKFLVVGNGYGGANVEYSLDGQTFNKITAFPYHTHYATHVEADGAHLIFGGSTKGTNVHEFKVAYDTDAEFSTFSWNFIGEMLAARVGPSAIYNRFENSITIIGGHQFPEKWTNLTRKYDGVQKILSPLQFGDKHRSAFLSTEGCSSLSMFSPALPTY